MLARVEVFSGEIHTTAAKSFLGLLLDVTVNCVNTKYLLPFAII